MIKTVISALVALFLAHDACFAQAQAWLCSDQRISISLWSSEVVQGTQMRFAPDGSLWVLELRGRLLKLTEGDRGVEAAVVLDLKEQAASANPQLGATSFVFTSGFDGSAGILYIAHNWDEKDGRRLGGVSRVVLAKNQSPQVRMIFGPIASASSHQVDRLIMDGDDLLLSTGDIWDPPLSQRDDGPHGKILRFPSAASSAGFRSAHPSYQIEAKGLRSPFALARRESDRLVVIGNNGPGGTDDALYVLKKGANYGWGATQPRAVFTPALYRWPQTVSPDAACFYEVPAAARHAWPQEYRDNLFVGLFGQADGAGADLRSGREPWERGRQILRFQLSGAGEQVKIEKVSAFLTYTGQGFESPLAVEVGPQGDLFLMTFAVDPDGPAVSRIYRLRMQASNHTAQKE